MSEEDRRPVIFLAFANDRDDHARYLRNLPEELRRVRERLDQIETGRLCEVVVRTGTTVGELLDVFQDARYRDRVAIFHFAGHAGGYQLLLESAEGRPEFAHAAGLADFLGHQRGLQLVFLNGCSTQPQVEGLLQSGVPAVIATSESIDDSMAMELSARFYAAVAGGATIANAYAESAAAVRTVKGGQIRDLHRTDAADSDRWPWDLYVKEGADIVRQWSLPLAAGDPLFGLPPVPEQDLPDTPYRHLQWFRAEDAELFFGRGREIRAFYELVTSTSAAPIVLFYGQSGVGKSSMLAAGLLPRLVSSHQVRYTRRQDVGLTATLAAALGAAAPDASLAVAWHAVESETGQPLVVILDQVEEVYTRPRPDDADELERFLRVVSETFADRSSRPRGKLVLGFRKEWLADLEERLLEKKLPRSKSYLERLDRDGIVEIVKGPAQSERLRMHFRLTVEPGLAELIADDLLEDPDAPVAPTLEVLLTKMWTQATARNGDAPAFTTDAYQELRRKGLLLGDFLSEQLSALGDWNVQVVNSGLALDLLAFHTTPLGTAESRTGAEVDAAYPHQSVVLPGLLQRSKDLYLLVEHVTLAEKEGDRAAATRLAHDTLAPLIRRRFKDSDAPGQRARRILENRGDDWRDGKTGNPLDQADLATVERGEAGMPAWSADERRLVQASRKRRRNRRWVGRGVVTTLLVAVAAIIGLYFSALANEKQAVSRALAASVDRYLREGSFDVALLVGVEATNIARTYEARNALLTALQQGPAALLRPPGVGLGSAVALALSPDGSTVATVHDSGETQTAVLLWNADSGKWSSRHLEGHPRAVGSLAFSPDGKLLALGGDSVALYDVSKGQMARGVLEGDSGDVASLVFSRDGRALTAARRAGAVVRWDVPSGRRLSEPVPAFVDTIWSLSGDTLATLSSRGDTHAVARWDLSNGRQLDTLLLLREGTPLALAPGGATLALEDSVGSVVLWDVARNSEIGQPLPPAPVPLQITDDAPKRWGPQVIAGFSPDGQILALAMNESGLRHGRSEVEEWSTYEEWATKWSTTEGTVILWDVARRELIGSPRRGHQGGVAAMSFSHDGQTLAASGEALTVWNIGSRRPGTRILGQLGKGGNSVAFSPDDRIVASGDTSKITFWNAESGHKVGELDTGLKSWVSGLQFSPDGKILRVGDNSGTVTQWEVAPRRPVGKPVRVDDGASMLKFSPEGGLVLSADDEHVAVWDLRAGSRLLDPAPGAFSSDGRALVWGVGPVEERELILWDLVSKRRAKLSLAGRDRGVISVALSPDGTSLALVGNEDNRILIWDLSRRTYANALPTLSGMTGNRLAFSPDGKTLASSGAAGFVLMGEDVITLWDVDTYQRLGEPLGAGRGSVHDLAWSHDGRRLASAGIWWGPSEVEPGGPSMWTALWEASVESWQALACRTANRNLTPEEWKLALPGIEYRLICPGLPAIDYTRRPN